MHEACWWVFLFLYEEAVPATQKKTAKNYLYRSNDLGGGLSPIEKYAGQIGWFPNVRMKNKKYLNCHPTSNYGLEL